MIQSSTAPAGPAGVPASAPAYYAWEVPEPRVSVHFSLDLIDRLEREALEAFRAVTQRGSEIGGLLLGRIESGATPRIVIEDRELLPCEYSRGPLYLLSEEEKARLADALVGHRTGLSAVGLFRSNTRKDLALDEDDLTAFSALLAADNLLLLIKPFATKPSLAAAWVRGHGTEDPIRQEFPFRRSELLKSEYAKSLVMAGSAERAPAEAHGASPAASHKASSRVLPFVVKRDEEAAPPPSRQAPETAAPPAEHKSVLENPMPPLRKAPEEAPAKTEPPVKVQPPAKPEPAVRAEPAARVEPPLKKEPAPAPAAVAPPVAAPLPTRPAQGGRKLWALFGGLAMLGLAAATGAYLKFKPPAAASIAARSDTPLQLKAEQNGAQLLVTWNSDADLIKTAQKAVLSISDGPQKEDVQLNLGQLRGGSLTYTPATADVSFRLEVTGAQRGTSRSEYVRVLRPVEAASGQTAPNQPVPPPAEASARQPNESKPQPAPEVVPETPAPPAAPPKPFTLASRIRPAAPSVALPEPPRVEDAAGSAPTRPIVSPVAPPPPPSKPAVQTPAPATQSAPPAPQSAAPASRPVQIGGKVVEPKLIRRIDPVYPPMARQARVSGSVRVQASIGKDGRIKKVEVLNGHPLLRQAAIDAVQKWIYNPSLLNGVPVDSVTEVELNFNLGSAR